MIALNDWKDAERNDVLRDFLRYGDKDHEEEFEIFDGVNILLQVTAIKIIQGTLLFSLRKKVICLKSTGRTALVMASKVSGNQHL